MTGIIFVLLALFLGFISGIFFRVPNQATAIGNVVSIEYKDVSNENNSTFYTVVEYEVNGTVYCVKSKHHISSCFVGQKKKVSYDAKNPENALIRPGIAVYIIMVSLFLAGFIIMFQDFLGV